MFFLLLMQSGLWATCPAPISTIFETTDVNRFVHAYTSEKFSNLCAVGFPGFPKQLKIQYSMVGYL